MQMVHLWHNRALMRANKSGIYAKRHPTPRIEGVIWVCVGMDEGVLGLA